MTSTAVTACTNQKGGVGETAPTINVAAALAVAGRNVLVVDLDPQGHLTEGVKLPEAPSGDEEANLYRALIGEFTGSIVSKSRFQPTSAASAALGLPASEASSS